MSLKTIVQDSSFIGFSRIAYMLSWSKPYIVKYRMKLIILFLLILAGVALSLIQVDYVQRSIDAVIVRDWRLLLSILAQFTGVTILSVARGYAYGHLSKLVDANMIRDARERYTQTVLHARMLDIEKESAGNLITRHNDDIPVATGFIRHVYSNFLMNPLLATGGFFYLMHFNWQLSLMVFLPIPIISLLLNHVSNRASRIYAGIMESRSSFTEELTDISQGMETVKAYNMQENRLEKVKTILGALFAKETRYNRIDSIALACIMMVSDLPQIISLVYGGFLVINGVIPVSVLVAYHLLIQRVSTPTINIFSSLHAVKNAYQSMKRLDAIMEIPAERKDGVTYPVSSDDTPVRLDHVDFAYDKDVPVLKDISMELAPGSCIGIAGDSGAGKSTIINLICGFYTLDSGRVSLFGKDAATWDLDALRSHIAYVSQDTYILPGTLAENIMFGSGEPSPERVMESARNAGLTDFIAGLPDGLETVLSEKGANLSGGQRQRISLARAALRDTSLYIFDEPTSALDPATESIVMDYIRKLVKTRPVILISHDLNPLRLCDRIYLVQDGQVKEQGTLDELMEKHGLFFDLFERYREADA